MLFWQRVHFSDILLGGQIGSPKQVGTHWNRIRLWTLNFSCFFLRTTKEGRKIKKKSRKNRRSTFGALRYLQKKSAVTVELSGTLAMFSEFSRNCKQPTTS
jgi:hypothetical protein